MSRIDYVPVPERDASGGRTIITAGWGDNRGHQGVDLGTTDGIEVGTPVYAPVSGKIAATLNDGPFRPPNGHTAGINVHLLGDDGSRHKFFHLNRHFVTVGQHVAAGEQIAEVGHSGTQAAHLHYEQHSGNFSNPINHTADVRDAINSGRWVGGLTPIPDDGSGNDHPNPVPAPEEDIVASREEIEQIINAAKDEVLAAVKAMDENDKSVFLARDEVSTGVYLVVNDVKYHISDPHQVEILKAVGTEDRGDQGAFLSAVPEQPWGVRQDMAQPPPIIPMPIPEEFPHS